MSRADTDYPQNTSQESPEKPSDYDERMQEAKQLTDEQLKAMALAKAGGEQQTVRASSGLKSPTETVNLPSKGLLYPEDNPLSKGYVEMHMMTAHHEDILTSQTLIKKRLVLDKLLESLIVDKSINLDDLFVGDETALLVGARVLGYGGEYKIEVNDPFARGKKETVTVNLTELEDKDIDWSIYEKGKTRFTYTLPHTQIKIQYRLLTRGLQKQIRKDSEAHNKRSAGTGISTELSTTMKYIITAVEDSDGVMQADRAFVNDFVDRYLLVLDSRAFRQHLQDTIPGLDLTFEYTSSETGETTRLELPLGASFFYPRS